MNIVILFDSYFGNTRKVAETIAEALRPAGDVTVLDIKSVDAADFEAPDLLIVGSPTRGFKPSTHTLEFFTKLPKDALRGVQVAAFDTRIALHTIESGILRFLVKTGGFAAKAIEKRLKRKGGEPVIPHDGFCVTDTEGPMLEGELERAREWGERIGAAVGLETVTSEDL